MNITILNGSPSGERYILDDYLQSLGSAIITRGHTVDCLRLRELEAGFCTGCWSCWVKTPGKCVFEDDSFRVCRAVINADFVLFASPVIMGFLSSVMKRFMDKMIPLVHPYITMDKGEAHHWHRYDPSDYPLGGLLLEPTTGSDEEDIEIICEIHSRTMLNLKSKNKFTMITAQPVEDVADAILSD